MSGRYTLASAVMDTRVFFAGGYTHATDSNVVDIIDVVTRTSTSATLKQARYGLAGASLRHIAMFFGGFYGTGTASNYVDMYNNVTKAWTQVGPTGSGTTAGLSVARGRGAATGVGNVIIFAGGRGQNDGGVNNVDIYNIVTGTHCQKFSLQVTFTHEIYLGTDVDRFLPVHSESTLCIVTSCSKCTRTLTSENFCQGRGRRRR